MNKPIDLQPIANLSAFAAKTGIPLRTLQRIKQGGPSYPMTATTRLALEAALKKLPKAKS